jgi:protein SCO1
LSTTIYRFAQLLGAVLAAASLVACGPGKPSFKSVDVTGADFGRELKLTDHTGKPRSLTDFQGKVVVVFFGFTQCPDVCPTTLVEMKAVKEKLGKDGERVQVLFVTVDPERDTAELLAKYVPAFDPTFIGLYGDAEATARTAKEFKVFYKKVPGSSPTSYSVDHTAALYIYDPSGRLRLFAKHAQGADALTHDIKLLLEQTR